MEARGREPRQGGEKEGYLIKYLFTNKKPVKTSAQKHPHSLNKKTQVVQARDGGSLPTPQGINNEYLLPPG